MEFTFSLLPTFILFSAICFQPVDCMPSRRKSTETKNSFMSQNEIQILNNIVNVKKIKASFAMKKNLVYFMVRFCTNKKPFCFMTNMYDAKANKTVNMDSIIQDPDLWVKLITTLNGQNHYRMTPVIEQHTTEREQGKCNGEYFFIGDGPSIKPKDLLKERGQHQECLSQSKNMCTRNCLKSGDEECREFRLTCNFEGCKCYKRVNLKKLRERNTEEKKVRRSG